MRNGEWDDTPAESPESKGARLHPSRALHALLKQICHRLRVIDRAQVYIIDQIENAPDSLSIVKVERAELEHKTHQLLVQWFETCGLRDRAPSKDFEDDRSSQSNININIESAVGSRLSAVGKRPSIFSTAKFRRIVILIGVIVAGTTTGIVWALKILHVIPK
jgi:hypothetical protein